MTVCSGRSSLDATRWHAVCRHERCTSDWLHFARDRRFLRPSGHDAPRRVALAAGYEGLVVRQIGTSGTGAAFPRRAIQIAEVAVIRAEIDYGRHLTLGARGDRAAAAAGARGSEGKFEFVRVLPVAGQPMSGDGGGGHRVQGVCPSIVRVGPTTHARDPILNLRLNGCATIGEYYWGDSGCLALVGMCKKMNASAEENRKKSEGNSSKFGNGLYAKTYPSCCTLHV